MGKVRVNKKKPQRQGKVITVARAESLPVGRGGTVRLPDGTELALFNVAGEFHAIENFCPHKGYPLANSKLHGSTVECEWHGWRFDLRDGSCFKKKKCSIESYEVTVIDGWIKITV